MKKSKYLTGQTLGMLHVDSVIVDGSYDNIKYSCTCSCGNSCTILHSSLSRKGRLHSCGCHTVRNLKPNSREGCVKAGLHRKDSFVNGCNIQMTFREGTISTNTSGVQGVSWSSSAHKWHVYVGYKNFRCNLAFTEDLELAKKLRAEAELAIKENRFEEFYFELRGHHLGDNQKQQFKTKQR